MTQCDSDGSYSAKQCSGSTGYCWCVGEDGIEFENSQQREWESGKLDCETMRAERAGELKLLCFVLICLCTTVAIGLF